MEGGERTDRRRLLPVDLVLEAPASFSRDPSHVTQPRNPFDIEIGSERCGLKRNGL